MFGTKYRPLDFDSVLGLDNVKDILKAIIKSGSYDPAYLFEGDYSSGKTTLARLFARSILCNNKKDDMSPCNECPSCKDFLSERNPSYIEIDAANNGSKEKIQELLEKLKYETVSGVVIIFLDECHEISKAGKDALLIELEKENKNVIFLFGTTSIDKMPPELRSRCVEFQLPQPTEAYVLKKLQKICELNSLQYTQDALFTIVQSSGRHYRDAEIKLEVTSRLGDINEENVAKVVTLYIKEIAYLLIALPYDLSKTFKAAEYLISRMNIKDLYGNILMMINDTIKYSQGFTFESASYVEILKMLSKQYSASAFEVLDYLLSRQRLNDLTLFHSDLLILHYKFLQGHFDKKELVLPKVVTPKVYPSNNDAEKKSGREIGLDYINQHAPWEREELVRQIKNKKSKENQDNRIEENVSKEWGPQIKGSTADRKAILRGQITKEAFKEAVKGSLDGLKV
jgi:DNA polymerase III subunit gamma/tau